MIEQRSPSSLRPVAMSPDDVSIGEIPPAMRQKLRSIGQLGGLVVGLVVFFGLVACRPSLQNVLSSRLGFDVPTVRLWSDCLPLMGAVALFGLPLLFARLNLLSEVRYRHKHGKWRWEW